MIILPKKQALEIYEDQKKVERLSPEPLRFLLRSVYFYRTDLLARDIFQRWTSDKITGQRFASPPFHHELWGHMDSRQDFLGIVHRDSAKTTAVSKIYCTKSLLYGLDQSILLIMSKGLGEEVIGDIQRELMENKRLRFIFGDLIPSDSQTERSKKWRARELQLRNDTEIKSATKGETIRGRRPTRILIDDPQEEKDVKNPRIAKAFYSWVWTTVYPALALGGSMAVLGTVISENCFVNILSQEAKAKKFKVIKYPILRDFDPTKDIDMINGDIHFKKGVSLWPERWPIKVIEQRCQKIGLDAFMQEMLNIPIILNGSPVFSKRYSYKKVNVVDVLDEVSFYVKEFPDDGFIGIDTASGRVGGDFSTVVCRDIGGKLLAQYKGYIAQDLLCKKVDVMATKFKNLKIVPENNNALAFLQEARNHAWYGSIYREKVMDKITMKESERLGWSTNGKTKPLLINGLDMRYRSGDWEVSPELYEEITHYYYNENGEAGGISPYHDDLVIADGLSVQAIKSGIAAPFLAFI